MRNIKVEVKAEDGPCGIDWTVDSKPPHSAKIELKKDSGAHKMVFDLDDETDRQLRFDCSFPIWVGEGCGCPPPPGIYTDQVKVISCDTDTLTIVNGNFGKQRILRYQLNMIDKDGNRQCVDPEIKNGGGIKTRL